MEAGSDLQPLVERPLNPREVKFWVLGVVVFCVDVLFQIIYSFLLLQAILNGTFVAYHIFMVLFYLFGIFLLGHALFVNDRFRQQIIAVYAWIFQAFPIVLYSFAFVCLCVGFRHFKEEFEKQYILANGTAVVIFLMIMCLVANIYHSFATYILFKFRDISGQCEALL